MSERSFVARVAAEIEANQDAFAELIAREAGKPIAQARVEVARGISTFQIASEEATRIGGEAMPLDITATSRGYSGTWVRVPAGPVLAIAPFNFPLNLVAHKLAPALACGCSVVLKPPPQTPLTSLLLGECIRRAGAPDDAVQVVPCDVPIAEKLVKDDRFTTLSFTGSANVGWHLKAICGKKRTLLELGGNAAVLIARRCPARVGVRSRRVGRVRLRRSGVHQGAAALPASNHRGLVHRAPRRAHARHRAQVAARSRRPCADR